MPRRLLATLSALLLLLASWGCSTLDEKQRSWIFQPSDRAWGGSAGAGGATAIDLATRVDHERGSIVEGTFTSIPDLASTFKWGWLPVGPLIAGRKRFVLVDGGSHHSTMSVGRAQYREAVRQLFSLQ